MPKLGDIPPEVTLAPGETVELSFDTSSDVIVIHGDRGTRYGFSVRLADGRVAVLKGGKRLLNSVQNAIGTSPPGAYKIRVRAQGSAGTLERQWFVEKVG